MQAGCARGQSSTTGPRETSAGRLGTLTTPDIDPDPACFERYSLTNRGILVNVPSSERYSLTTPGITPHVWNYERFPLMTWEATGNLAR